jgi:Protein of unknown function (DUF4238)
LKRPKRHHYLPRFYLRNFCRNGRLWVFDREKNEFRNQAPPNTALENDFYTVELDSGEKYTEIETWLSEVENKAKPALDNLVSRKHLKPQERADLALFFALFQTRTPEFKALSQEMVESLVKGISGMLFGNEEYTSRSMERYEKETGKKLTLSPREMAENISRGNYKVRMADHVPLQQMLSTSFEVASHLAAMDWRVFFAPETNSFVTTDNPFVIVPPPGFPTNGLRGVGVLTTGAIKVIPLSQAACLLIGPPGNSLGHKDCDKQEVRCLNLALVDSTNRFVYGRDRALVKSLVNTAGLHRTMRGRRIGN